MLQQALKAGIPVISARTTDLVNLAEVLETLSGKKPTRWSGPHTSKVQPDSVYFTTTATEVTETAYQQLVEGGSVLVLVNRDEQSPYAFDAGEVPVPQKLVLEGLAEVSGDPDSLLPLFKGLTIKQMVEVVRLVTADGGGLSPRAIRHTRQMLTGVVPGLEAVHVDLECYTPDPELKQWVMENRKFFEDSNAIKKLRPRGVLLNGEPGVGKTMGAKYIAAKWELPLYRVDVGASLDKYHGESERRFASMLRQLDDEAPCVALFDEVDRMFAESDDGGVKSGLLAQYLWWLNEHSSKVLTVMTTNRLQGIPPELYRPGRIDHVFTIEKLLLQDAVDLAEMVLKSMGLMPAFQNARATIKSSLSKTDKRISHSEVTQIALDAAKVYCSSVQA